MRIKVSAESCAYDVTLGLVRRARMLLDNPGDSSRRRTIETCYAVGVVGV
ncbi:hypothetical protein SAMN05216319_4965 [Duganella sp. CF402]|nr:hypothetical protein EV582_4055 [Duganella sp. BK701]SEM93084.1 hypothetical protein SAMN05216319_4965 [Duganella sp. CF402]